jgi:hypothetical protein
MRRHGARGSFASSVISRKIPYGPSVNFDFLAYPTELSGLFLKKRG